MEGYAEVTDSNVSKLNSGGLINIRIHNLWVERHKFAQNGQYSKWNDILDAVWCELGADVVEGKAEDLTYQRLTLGYAQACGGQTKTKGFDKMNESTKGSLVKQKIALIKKELFLRRLQNKQGKGTAYIDEDDFE
tara:strand:- start:380 stop:784 length:405 start_codon:yes stop_codon:yes gene_type:complete